MVKYEMWSYKNNQEYKDELVSLVGFQGKKTIQINVSQNIYSPLQLFHEVQREKNKRTLQKQTRT